MKAIRIPEPNKWEVKDIAKPEPSENDVLIKVMACGICGTDIHIFKGRYFGDYPVIPGHEFSGIVEKTGRNVTKFEKGNRVAVEPNISCDNCYNCLNKRQQFCLNWKAVGVTNPGGMAQYVIVPEKNVFNIEDVSFEQGAFVEPLSCVLHGLERAEITIADKVAILGAGPIGLMMVKMIRMLAATEIIVVDRVKSRAEYAGECGANRVLFGVNDLPVDYFDVVVDATGVTELMAMTLDFVRYGGTVLLFGVPPSGKKMEIEPFKIFRKGLKVLSSYTSLRNSYQAVNLLKFQRIDVGNLVSHRFPLESFEEGVQLIEKGRADVKKVMILPNG
jgi:2-desacetyl-2-hydroxyethyl bacteriochlorophyllide A dehydrogenase